MKKEIPTTKKQFNSGYLSPLVIRRKKRLYELTLNIPRYLTFDKGIIVKIQNEEVRFNQEDFYEQGIWKFTLISHETGVNLETIHLKGLKK